MRFFFPPKGYILSLTLRLDRGQNESCVLPTLFPAYPNSTTRLYRAPNPRANTLWCGSDTKKPRFCTSILQPSEVNNIQKVATLNFDDKIGKKKKKGMFFCSCIKYSFTGRREWKCCSSALFSCCLRMDFEKPAWVEVAARSFHS